VSDDSFLSILRAARANGEWAWRELYDANAPRLLQYLRSQGIADPEGALGDVMVRVVRGIHNFEGDEDAFRGWLFRIAQNAVIDARRRSRIEHEFDEAQLGTSPDVADSVEAHAEEARLYRTLRVLPHDQRAVVFMRVVLDLPFAEIARVLGRRESAVKMLQQRAFKTLRKRGIGVPDA
jgi:RNA polymerase sigma-70 factor (ECF subfamily)